MASNDEPSSQKTDDEDLEEGELKDDDDDDDDYDKREVGEPPQTNHHPMIPGPPQGPMYGREPGPAGPSQKSNARCRFYSRTSNKCTWGDRCRFEHRDDSPGPGETIDNGMPPVPHPSMPPRGHVGPPPLPMGPAERPYPPYGRGQPYPMGLPNYGPYDPYAMGSPVYGPYDHPYGPPPPPPHHHQSSPLPPPNQPASGAPVVGFHNPASSAPSALYERKQRLAYELAPWNDRNSAHSSGNYPTAPGPRFYRGHYSRDPYTRAHAQPPGYYMPSAGPPHPAYSPNYPPNHPSSYRTTGVPYPSHRNMAIVGKRSGSNKRAHDEDESSWSDSGSDDSILAQASYSNKNHAHKSSKKLHHHHIPAQHPPQHHQNQRPQETSTTAPLDHNDNSNDNPLDQGSGTPPGEPLPEDKERQEMLLNKLREIEDLMAKKKGEQQDPV